MIQQYVWSTYELRLDGPNAGDPAVLLNSVESDGWDIVNTMVYQSGYGIPGDVPYFLIVARKDLNAGESRGWA